MKSYRVKWEIDVEADDAVQAARIAVALMKRRYERSIAHVFDVTENKGGRKHTCRVDLDEIDGKGG